MFDLRDQRILVTGATGFIGSHVALRLFSEGADVVALERTVGKGDFLRANGIRTIRGDISSPEQMGAILASGFEVVVHLAAVLGRAPRQTHWRGNVVATQQLARLSAEADVSRFVYTSSIMVYGPHGDADVDEETTLKAYGDPYGDSKIASELALKGISSELGLCHVILRPGMVYGPGSSGWTVRMARWAKYGILPFLDNGSGTAFPIFIDNLVDLLMLCIGKAEAVGQTFNAVDDGPITLAEFFGPYMDMIPTGRCLRIPGKFAVACAKLIDPFYPPLSLTNIAIQLKGKGRVLNAKAKEILGWQPRIGMYDGMKRSERWLRDKGYI